MFDLYEFKQRYSVNGKDVVNCLSAYYPKFTKAVESYASRPSESGIALTAEAVELLNCHYNPKRHRKRSPADGMRQVRCRVSPTFADALNEMAKRKGKDGVRGCQVDLLIQAQRTVCVVEIKRRSEIGRSVIDEVAEKISKLAFRPGISVRTALVYEGRLSPQVEAEGYFDLFILDLLSFIVNKLV